MGGIGVPELIIILIIWVIPGTIGAILAKNKGRNAVGWFFLSAIFWFPIIIVIFLPPVKEVPGKYRECPSCREIVKWNAIICKHCKSELAPKANA
jgi:hypothetical protein